MAKGEEDRYGVAAIFGVTGLVGKELARTLLSTRKCKKVYGIARAPDNKSVGSFSEDPSYHFIACDLLNSSETSQKLSPLTDTTHVFWVTWASQFGLDGQECCEQNKAMMSNAINAILPKAKSLKHVSLQTGAKHYVSLPDLYSSKQGITTCYDENSPRTGDAYNFYYALEDLLHETLRGRGVAWSIHRPGVIMGCSKRTLYNFIGSICVYGTICKHLSLPFVFGGTKQCWEEMYIDASDARLVAEQHVWAATMNYDDLTGAEVANTGRAFNAVNGERYTWREIWPSIGRKLGIEQCEFSGDFSFSSAMKGRGGVWREIVEREGLVDTEMEDLANWDFLDVLFRFPVKMLCSRNRADEMGFKTRYNVLETICYWIDVMRAENLIP